MSIVVLIPWAKTDWTESKRLTAEAPLPLTREGVIQAEEWGGELAARKLTYVFCSEELTSRETAEAVARPGKLRVKSLKGLEEVDFGLWEGLAPDTLKARFPKVYKRWQEDPSSVRPPEGEALADAAGRIHKALRKAARKGGDDAVGVVLAPIACAIARCELESTDLSALHGLTTIEPVWYDGAQETNGNKHAPAFIRADAAENGNHGKD